MMLFACLRMMGHGDDSPRDGNDNWMAIASLSSPAMSSILGDSHLLFHINLMSQLHAWYLTVFHATREGLIRKIKNILNFILLIDLLFTITILVIKIPIIILH